MITRQGGNVMMQTSDGKVKLWQKTDIDGFFEVGT